MRSLRLACALMLCATGAACCKEPPLPPPAAGEKVFDVHAGCDNDPHLMMRRVVLAPTETRIYLRVENKTLNVYKVSTSPPGQADTFFLESADQHRHVQLVRSSGIAVTPAQQDVDPGGSVDFVLYFPAIDESWGPIDLHEGEVRKAGTTYWNWTHVALK